jgi:hypothetical protein
MLSFLLVVACAHRGTATPEPVAPPPVTTLAVEPTAAEAGEMATPPYTADQIREAMPVGTMIVYRRVEAGKDPYLDRMTVTAADATTCTIADAVVDADGKVLTDHGTQTAAWEELRKHAEFPVAGMEKSDSSVDVPAGHFGTWKYVVTAPDGMVSTYHFAPELPGPPVWMEMRAGDVVAFSMVLVSRSRGSAGP